MFAEFTELDNFDQPIRVININPRQVVEVTPATTTDAEGQRAMLVTEITTLTSKRRVSGSRTEVMAKLEGRVA